MVRSLSDQSIGSTVASPTNSPVCASVPAPAQRANGRREAVRMPGALDRDVDTEAVGLLAQERRNVDGRRVEHGGDPERLGPRASRRVRLRDVDRRGAGRAGAERGERADRPGARDEHPVAGADAGALDAVRGDRGRLDQRALPVASRRPGAGRPGTRRRSRAPPSRPRRGRARRSPSSRTDAAARAGNRRSGRSRRAA